MKLSAILQDKRVACPECKSTELTLSNDSTILCAGCGAKFEAFRDIPILLPSSTLGSKQKEEIQSFWNELYDAAYGEHEQLYNKDNFACMLLQLRKLFEKRGHLAAVEMDIDSLGGKNVLEVGCGAGAHSSLFCMSGATMTSLDITFARVAETSRKLDLVGGDKSFSLQGDSESLPFPDDFFDIVYSNGVLHHTYDTGKAIAEIQRVLCPGGTAVIMLYAKDSFYYWVANYLVQGLLLGKKFRYKNWLGRSTEWMSPDKQQNYNPETKAYTRDELFEIFSGFNDVAIRKNGFVVQQIPFIGKYLSRLIGLFKGYDQAGSLLYDQTWRNDTGLELWLGRYMGFAYNIKAVKASKK